MTERCVCGTWPVVAAPLSWRGTRNTFQPPPALEALVHITDDRKVQGVVRQERIEALGVIGRHGGTSTAGTAGRMLRL
jgi:hypothetical protein